MSSPENVDLSRLKINRETVTPKEDLPKPRFWLLIYAACAAFLLLGGFFFYRSFSTEQVVELTTVTLVSPSQASSLLTASGYVVAQRKASLASKATGRLVYLGFREGDKVKKGDIIGRIESADVEALLSQASADLDVAKADQNDAGQSLLRAETLLKRNLISQAEFDAAQSRYDRMVASIASKRASLKAAEVQLENTRIRAPFDGTVLTKNADIGEVVAPFAAGASSRVAIVTIADMASLEVEADVSESNIEKIIPQQPCEIVLDAYPDHRYSGFVSKIVPTADRAKATVLTKIRFYNRDSRVLPEMSAKVHFLPMNAPVSTDSIPRIAVNPGVLAIDGTTKMAFIVRDEIATAVPVETGETLGTLIEIKKGLSVGDRVVLKPSPSLGTGTKVKLKD